MSSTDAAEAKTIDIPLDILYRIAEIVAQPTGYLHAARRDLKTCCLVNRLFAEVFRPHVFHWTVIPNSTGSGHPRKQLDILTSSPHIGVYLKRLTLMMHDGGDETVLCAIFDGGFLTSLKSLTILGNHWASRRIPWSALSEPFTSSIQRFCSDSQTLQTLNLLRLDGIPASVFAQPALTSICLAASRPIFNFPEPHIAPSRLPLSLNICGVDFSGFQLEDVVKRGRGFFSRVHSLKATTSWRPEPNAAFDKFLSLIAPLSHLESLDVSIFVHPSPTFKGKWIGYVLRAFLENRVSLGVSLYRPLPS
jgi:hypothetical protein